MHYKKELSAYIKKLKKHASEHGEVGADNYYTVLRECAPMKQGKKTFGRFCASGKYENFREKLSNIISDGVLPEEDEFIRRFDGFITIDENENIVNSIKLFLAEAAAIGCTDGDETRINAAVRSFFTLKNYSIPNITRSLCKADIIFSSEKAGIYPDMAQDTKNEYLKVVRSMAGEEKISPEDCAEKITREADKKGIHIGFLLPVNNERKKEGRALILAPYFVSFAACFALSILTESLAAGILAFLPMTEVFICLTRLTAAARRKPRHICRMSRETVRKNAKTAIAVSVVLPKAGDFKLMQEHLQSLYLANRAGANAVCLLADLPPASTPEVPGDLTNIEAAVKMTERLNGKFGDKFILAIRERTFSKSEGKYIGCERKRGAVMALTKLIATGKSDFKLLRGNVKALTSCEYIMLLDSDTEMPFDSLSLLTAAALHPLNRPDFDSNGKTVTKGFGIFAPMAAPSVKSFSASRFSRDMCKIGGIAAYDPAANDFYGDFFGDGIFCGKGLICANTFYNALNGRFRDETMLSHDIAEGLILRVLPVTDVTLTDDFPRTEAAYLKRAHRWIRGDVQNIPLLKRSIYSFGKNQKSPFCFEDRYKLFDNIRRAVTPAACFIGFIASVFLPIIPAAALAAVCISGRTAGDIIGLFSALLRGGIRALSGLYKGDVLPEAVSFFIRAVLLTAQTGVEAVNSLDALIRSAFRMTITKKRLLEWTTAAASNGDSNFFSFIPQRIPAIIASVLMFLSRKPLCVLIGILFIFDLFYAYFSQREIMRERPKLSERGKDYVFSECAAMWRYFADNFKEEYNFLPPDNVSISPLNETAERTSPTNIGLFLCSCLAARDFGFIDSSALFSMLDKTVTTIEKLEKTSGNLLNWYDIKTLLPLKPEVASFVDSGNFICCITALKEGLYEYVPEEARLLNICARLSRLRSECRLDVFYNSDRRLFAVSMQPNSGELSSSYYDLLMSEARMASYIAVADGLVPAEHWAALSRTAAKCGRFSGALSWSGTMFEYFMPYIFLPSGKNTLSDESLWFSLKCQSRFAAKNGIPRGLSECCFYTFNRDLSYSYKAIGVPAAALKRFSEIELTVSPYSTFLTMPFSPQDSFQNLKRLEKYPSKGEYGFFEALDFTPSRSSKSEPSTVRCFMAHHIGMSILAGENAVNGMIWQKRFMRDSSALSAASLLEEKMSPDSAYYKQPEKEPPEKEKEKKRERKDADLTAALYKGADICAAVHKSGCMNFFSRGVTVIRKTPSFFGEPTGIFAALKTLDGIIPFTEEPLEKDNCEFSYTFGKSNAEYKSVCGNLILTEQISLDRNLSCAKIRYKITNKNRKPLDASLLIFLEPSLTRGNEETVHRAYSKLFIQSKKSDSGCVVFTRYSENCEDSIAAGFSDADYSFTTDKDSVIPMGGSVRELFSKGFDFNGRTGSVDCCFCAKTDFSVGAQKELSFSFYLCAGDTAESAERIFETAANTRFTENRQGKIYADDIRMESVCSSVLSETVFPQRKYKRRSEYADKNNAGIESLWAAGISGDDPIILYRTDGRDFGTARDFASVLSRLAVCGIKNDMVIIQSDKQDYVKNTESEITAAVSGFSGNIYVFSADRLPSGAEDLISAHAAAIYPSDFGKTEAAAEKLFTASAYNPEGRQTAMSEDGFFIAVHPPVPWCRTLCNRSFGCLVSDRGLGFTWALNSAENKLTPWTNDPHSDISGEILTFESGEKHFDITSAAAATLGEKTALWQSTAEECVFTVKVTVPDVGMRKNISVTVKNRSREDRSGFICLTVNPVMGRDLNYSKTIKEKTMGDTIIFSNPYNRDFNGFMLLSGENAEICKGLCFRKNAALSDGVTLKVRINLAAEEEYTARFVMTFGMTEKSVLAIAEAELPAKRETHSLIASGDEITDEFVNRYLVHQVKSTRIFARCAFYQCGGAYGFRDQLQDCLNYAHVDPNYLRIQLLRCAASQFPEGDVLHWWHVLLPEGRQEKRGVRTRCSDDLVWLPFATAEYIEITGDSDILKTEIPFCGGRLLNDREKDMFFTPIRTEEKASLYIHCVKALDKALEFGAHGLVLMQSGDWNDSFGEVGANGHGESVWLSMFCVMTLKRILPLCRKFSDNDRYSKYSEIISSLTESIQNNAWDKDRYLRAFYDDGTPMGAKESETCKIDLLPQSFASLAELPDKEKTRTALKTAYNLLYDKEVGIIKLFSPPFLPNSKKTGYVNCYPPGVRENGGQYTHAAVWFMKALYKEGFHDEAKKIFDALNPFNKLEKNGLTGIYRAEPYAMSADVYSLKNYEGRAGWSLYTGAAGWMLSTALEIFPPQNTEEQESPEQN